MNKIWKTATLALSLAVASSQVAVPGEPAPCGGALSRVEAVYRAVRTFRARFIHTLDAPTLNQHEREEGTLLLAKGGRMRWEYARPAGKLAWADGAKSYLLLPEEHEVLVQPLGKDLPVRLLLGTADLAHECTCTGFRKLQGEIELTLEVADPDLGIRDLVLRVEDHRGVVTSLTYRDPLGNRVTFTFTEIEVDAAIPDSAFKVALPRGLKVIENP